MPDSGNPLPYITGITESLINDAKKHGLIVFAGAGISVPAPSSCPTWIGLRREILIQFLDKLIREDWPSKPYLEKAKACIPEMQIRPETFMWALTSTIGIQKTTNMISGINYSSPNLNHDAIASLVDKGTVTHVITTNFDTYIEDCLKSRKIRYAPIRDTIEVTNRNTLRNEEALLFKPHGCLSKPSSLEYRLDQIQVLPENKMKLLTSILKSSPVLIVGYSGNDEDIFPVIKKSLLEGRFRSYICIFPGSPDDEPIQKWDIRVSEHINRFYADPMDVLNSLLTAFEDDSKIFSDEKHFQSLNMDHVWTKAISSCVEDIPHDIIAMVISHLCSLHGNHHRALRFANLAQDICEDTDLSRTPRESLLFIKELQSRAYKELGHGQVAENLQGSRLREALEGSNNQEVISTLIDRAHVALRNNNLESAERDLDLVGAHLRKKGIQRPEDADYNALSFLWYSGILKRKQLKSKTSDLLFNQAVAIAHAQHDIIHGGRILMDYGYVKCQIKDWESAQQVWGLSVTLAEQANDWSTAAKAAKNRGLLLSMSDKPHLGKPELERSRMFFMRAGDPDGAKRATEALGYSYEELLLTVMSLGKQIDG